MNIYYFIFLLANVIWVGISLIALTMSKFRTVYQYDFDTIHKKDETYATYLMQLIQARGHNGWKYVSNQEIRIEGAKTSLILVTFVKTYYKFRLL